MFGWNMAHSKLGIASKWLWLLDLSTASKFRARLARLSAASIFRIEDGLGLLGLGGGMLLFFLGVEDGGGIAARL